MLNFDENELCILVPSYSTITLIHLTHLEHLRLCINKEKQPGLKLDLSTEILYCVFAHNKVSVEAGVYIYYTTFFF